MSGKMEANPGSGRIWHLIMGLFRGSSGTPPRIVQEIFAASILWRQQWTAMQQNRVQTLLQQYSAVTAASSF